MTEAVLNPAEWNEALALDNLEDVGSDLAIKSGACSSVVIEQERQI